MNMFSWEYFRIYIHSIGGFVKVEVDRNAVYIVQVMLKKLRILIYRIRIINSLFILCGWTRTDDEINEKPYTRLLVFQ